MDRVDCNTPNAINGESDGNSKGRTSASSFALPDSEKDQMPVAEASHPQGLGDGEEKQTTAPKPGPGPPPNGGLVAWLQVVGGFFLNFNTWGLINTFGIFQAQYSTDILTGSSQSAISWIGSIQGFLMLIVGVLCGRAIDAGYFYADILTGAFLQIFGMMMVSICKEYWQFVLAQGVVVGIGCGCSFIPSVAIVGTYFSTKRSLALGIAATGSSVGGVIYPIVLRELIRKNGFGWAVRVMAFIMLGTLLIPIAVMRTRLPPRKSGPVVDLAALRDPPFAMFLVSVLFMFIGLYVPFFYVETYALSIGVHGDLAFYMLIIMSAASVPGRLLPPFIADRIGNLNVMVPSAIFSGIILLAWISVKSQPSLIAISIFFGFTSGSIQAVLPAVVAFLAPDLSKIGTRIGMTLFIAGIALLIGSPIAGAIVDHQSDAGGLTFWGLLVFAGVVVLVGGVCLVITRVVKIGSGLKKA